MQHSIAFTYVFALTLLAVAGCSSGNTFEDAEAAMASGDYHRSLEILNRLALTSTDPAIFGNRASCHSYLGNLEAALADYDIAVGLAQQLPRGRRTMILASLQYNRGFAYQLAGDIPLAIENYEKTIAIKPDYPDVTNNLAWILATHAEAEFRNPLRAVELAQAELERQPDSDAVLDTLAASYAAAGDFPKAVSAQEKAIALANDQATETEYNERLALYAKRQAYIEPLVPK